MEPRIVEQAQFPPAQCLFSQDTEGPFIDTGMVAPWIRPYGYLSVSYVEYLAKHLLGMVSMREVEKEVEELRDRVAAYGAKVEQLQAFADASNALEEV